MPDELKREEEERALAEVENMTHEDRVQWLEDSGIDTERFFANVQSIVNGFTPDTGEKNQ